jgi:hypothetical protein
MPVVNPFAPHLAFPHASLSARRDQKKYLLIIRAVALVHQHQRKIEDGAVVVDARDVEIADRIANETLGRSLYDLSPPSRRLLVAIREWRPEGEFSQRELRARTGWRRTQLAEHVKELVETEYLVRRSLATSAGRRVRYVLDWDGRGLDGEKFFKGAPLREGAAAGQATSGSSGPRPPHVRSTSGSAESSPTGSPGGADGTSGGHVRPEGPR